MQRKTLEFRVQFPKALVDRVSEIADQEKTTPAYVLQRAFQEWQQLEDERRRLTLKALADGDAGRVVPHEAVEAWMESLGTDSPKPFPHA